MGGSPSLIAVVFVVGVFVDTIDCLLTLFQTLLFSLIANPTMVYQSIKVLCAILIGVLSVVVGPNTNTLIHH